ncbi:hypothetical protein F5Y16DRAFT_367841 [Xylariaceae sp. FL0255]|nr:hypothetical protein F5Y16DRAFT_367841 [Xylariaceae sp. FL0255]
MSLINGTSTSAFLYCPPTSAPLYTTVYETVLLAACETSSWQATYTVSEVCTGAQSDYVTPTIPPGFVVTTVNCNNEDVEITCPGAQPTGMGMPTVSIEGNGVTATIVATPPPAPPAAAPAMGGAAASPAAVMGGAAASAAPAMPTATLQTVVPAANQIGGSVGGSISNGSAPAQPTMPVMAGASSTKRSLLAGAGLAVLALPVFLL